jgi:hypothetical protein
MPFVIFQIKIQVELPDRLAITLVNRQQIAAEHFLERDGGAVEFTEASNLCR